VSSNRVVAELCCARLCTQRLTIFFSSRIACTAHGNDHDQCGSFEQRPISSTESLHLAFFWETRLLTVRLFSKQIKQFEQLARQLEAERRIVSRMLEHVTSPSFARSPSRFVALVPNSSSVQSFKTKSMRKSTISIGQQASERTKQGACIDRECS
jgi:hypothetical protein